MKDFYGKNDIVWIFFGYLLINILYLIIIPFKTPDYDQVEMDQEALGIALALEENKIEKSQYYAAQQEAKLVVQS